MSEQDPKGLPSFDNEMAEILESFIVETREIFESLGQNLLDLENGNASPEMLNTIFRAVHTVKGTSSFLGLEQMTALAHSFEDVLNKLRKGELSVNPAMMDTMIESYDLMKVLLQRIEQRDGTQVDLKPVLARLETLRQQSGQGGGTPPPALAAPPPKPKPEPEPALEEETAPVEGPEAPAEQAMEHGSDQTPDPGVDHERPDETAGGARRPDSRTSTPAQQTAAGGKSTDTTIRVDVGRLDSLMNLVGELVLGRNRLAQIASQFGEAFEGNQLVKDLTETSSQVDFITTELQAAVMKTRMVPIAKVFNRIPRLIRDLCKETGKDIALQMSGEETELDRSIIEELADPLVHIIRNSADHGVESQEARRAAGKPAQGVVTVKAEHEGNNIVITIQDDGKGMDPEILKRKAVEKGIITEAKAAEMSKRDAFNLIFLPGFSTAAKVTNISGRGVGMDVVHTNITKLKGVVEIESEYGVGSTFIIKLPLTLAIIQGLLVDVSSETFCIPLNSVLEVIRIRKEEINTITGKEVIRVRSSVLPVARLTALMRADGPREEAEWLYVVVIGLAEQRLGVVVDALVGQKEVVIKSLGAYLGSVKGIAGSTILGDGRVIMIVDVSELMHLHAQYSS